MATDFSLRNKIFDSYDLLPKAVQEIDLNGGGTGAYRIVTEAWNQQWYELYQLINGLIAAHEPWHSPANTLPFLAEIIGTPNLQAFDPSVRNALVSSWSSIRTKKGTQSSIVSLASLLGYWIKIIPLWQSYVIPNPANLSDPVNLPYLSDTPQFPPAINGALNPAAVSKRAGNSLWMLSADAHGGDTVINLVNSPAFLSPTIGYTIFFPNRLEPYTVAASTLTSLTLNQPLSIVTGEINVPQGTQIPVFDPAIIYASSFFDISVVMQDPTITDPTSIVTQVASKVSVLSQYVIPLRDSLRNIRSSYTATATYTAKCPFGVYGTPIIASGTGTSELSITEAEANALAAATANASATLVCHPIPPVISINEIEPLAATSFYSTLSYTAFCPTGYFGLPSTISVTRTSRLSQADADSIAFTAAYGLANAALSCTRNVAPLIGVITTNPTYSATVSLAATCPGTNTGVSKLTTITATSIISYEDAQTNALAQANSANASLICPQSSAIALSIRNVYYSLKVGATATAICPASNAGSPVTVADLFSYESTDEFTPSFDTAERLAIGSAYMRAHARLNCTPISGPTVSIGAPSTTYAAVATATAACAVNLAPGNVVTVSLNGSASTSYADALTAAQTAATTAASASLNCVLPAFTPDSLLLVAKDEFGLNPIVVIDKNGIPFNSGNDFYAQSIAVGTAKSDFNHFINVDLPRLKSEGITRIVVEIDWFSPSATNLVVPMVSAPFQSRTTVSTPWGAGGVSLTGVSVLPGGFYRGGTTDDASLLAALTALAGAGVSIGLAPVLRFPNSATGVDIDRGLFSLDSASSSVFNAFITSYNTFVTYYVNLLSTHSISPSIFYIGSGYRGLTNSANLSYRVAFLRALRALANVAKSSFSTAQIIYAAQSDEYGYNETLNDFPLDGLWSDPNITLGINHIEPSSTGIAPTLTSARLAAQSGENFFYEYNSLNSNNRLLTQTDRAGKTNAIPTAINSNIGHKNLKSFLSSSYYHYINPPAGFPASATPLVGNNFYDTNVNLSGLTIVPGAGSAFLETRFNYVAPRDPGLALRLSSSLLTGLVLGTGGSASFALPTSIAAGNVSDTTFNILVKPDYNNNPPMAFAPTVLSIPDGPITIAYDGVTRRIFSVISLAGASTYSSVGIPADDGVNVNYYIRYFTSDGINWKIVEGSYVSGTLVATTYNLPSAPKLVSSAGLVYLGSNGSTNYLNGVINQVYMSAFSSTNPTLLYGGTFYFEETYCGTRTNFKAENVTAIASELGVPSVFGGLVEPSRELRYIPSGFGMTLPSWLPAAEAANLTKGLNSGIIFSDITGPYGCSFTRDNYTQLYGLISAAEALRSAGITSIVAAEYDVRSSAAITATNSSGRFYYRDAVLYPYGRVLNGKLPL